MLNFIKDNSLMLVLTVLPLSILANNLLGAALAGMGFQFDKARLGKGLTKGCLVYLGILIYAGISMLMKDLSVELNGELYTLVDAMYVIILGTIVKYVKQGIEKLMEIVSYKVSKEED